jgi:hypothetical protein
MKPRVVIFQMTASQLIRSIATVSEAIAMSHFVAPLSAGKQRSLAEIRLAGGVESRKCQLQAEGTAAPRSPATIKRLELPFFVG